MSLSFAKTYLYGVSEPLDVLSSPGDCEASTDAFESALCAYDIFESTAGFGRRAEVLQKVKDLVCGWVYSVAAAAALPDADLMRDLSRLHVFGSYRLGIVSSTSDIDALCIVPDVVGNADFFGSFVEILRAEALVTEITSVPAAYTPILNFVFADIEIDLLLAPVPLESLKHTSILNDEILKNLDKKTVRSLNGCRVNDMLLSLVPQEHAFISSCRFIKFWAKRRHIYSNIIGYLGGVAWSILTARVCQLYPRYSPNQIVERFFELYRTWQWPNPVLLTYINIREDVPELAALKPWDHRECASDRLHLMPIITPAFPCMNSTHNVSKTTLAVMQAEFQRAHGVLAGASSKNWNAVLAEYCLREEFSVFLNVVVCSTETEHFLTWFGFVESKIRNLYKMIEADDRLRLRPDPSSYASSRVGYALSRVIAAGVDVDEAHASELCDFSGYIRNFLGYLESLRDKSVHSSAYEVIIEIKDSLPPAGG